MFSDLAGDLEAPPEAGVALRTVTQAMERVSLVLAQLEARRSVLEARLGELDERRRLVLESWG